ncbi:MAG: superoxide dismutase, Ni [SAR202 cluster bacterium Io17-Chloro-G9]|nr:MAG: superoxide dismutase, Ni [SAR202 cluster bacterium Io17-Chloro-G9]
MFNPLGWINPGIAQAHCDIPCGIYDPIAAKIAAQTVQKMVLRMQALEAPGPDADVDARKDYVSKMGRYTTVKEEHAEICKRELSILWADYAWPNQPAGFDLHGTFNAALKLAGRCKQNVDMAACEELVATCDNVATAFWATKNVEYSDPNAAARYGA